MPCGIARLLCLTWTLPVLAVILCSMLWTLPGRRKKKGENSRSFITPLFSFALNIQKRIVGDDQLPASGAVTDK
ncbi:hypothetical protein DFH11DRAFT_1609002 [Phellopilus nigrolimitatus]|nr:hypothetical protein DFH11DRAFT_1609002 [Phellopilus nigrolimitatus]